MPTLKKQIKTRKREKKPHQQPIAVLGAGSWGTALALYLSRRGQAVRIWSVETSEITSMLSEKANNRYLPGIPLPDLLQPMVSLEEAVKDVSNVIMAVPSVGYRNTLKSLKAFITPNVTIINASKGIDAKTGQFPNEMVEAVLGKKFKFAVLSGPSFAREVAVGLPCAVVIASKHKAVVDTLIRQFDSPIFRVQGSNDVIGVEIGGIVKNVIAIATGLFDGMELGANARSALITLGLQEIIRLGMALGGKIQTFTGLSGIGDLMLTCMDNQSRNRRLGLFLGQGDSIEKAEGKIGQAVEGKRNAELVVKLAKRHQIHMPISESIKKLLLGKITAKEIIPMIFSKSKT